MIKASLRGGPKLNMSTPLTAFQNNAVKGRFRKVDFQKKLLYTPKYVSLLQVLCFWKVSKETSHSLFGVFRLNIFDSLYTINLSCVNFFLSGIFWTYSDINSILMS